MPDTDSALSAAEERQYHERRSALVAALYDDGCITAPQTDHLGHVLASLAAHGWTLDRAHDAGDAGGTGLDLDALRPPNEVPPLPWTSPALMGYWPDEAAHPSAIKDATGAVIFPRNWRESAAAIRHALTVVNAVEAARLANTGSDSDGR